MRGVGFSIEDDQLVWAGVSFIETPNKGGDLAPRYLAFHYTAGRSAASSINWLMNPESKASAHLVLARDGTITQLAPFKCENLARGPESLGWVERTQQLLHWDRDG